MFLPIRLAPNQSHTLHNGVALIPHRRIKLPNGQISDSDIVAYRAEEDLRDWLLFHAFVVDSDRFPLNHYQSQAPLEETDQPNITAFDYGQDIVPEMYLNVDPPTDGKRSYDQLFELSSGLPSENIDRVRTSLLTFPYASASSETPLLDPTYWALVASFSVIEWVVGEQPSNCSVTCDKCGKTLSHRPKSEKVWFTQRLIEIMGESEVTQSYTDLILAVRDQIRHKTVHGGLHPQAEELDLAPGAHIYGYKRAIEGFKEDAMALRTLYRGIHATARRLLIAKLLNVNVFPRLPKSVVYKLEQVIGE